MMNMALMHFIFYLLKAYMHSIIYIYIYINYGEGDSNSSVE